MNMDKLIYIHHHIFQLEFHFTTTLPITYFDRFFAIFFWWIFDKNIQVSDELLQLFLNLRNLEEISFTITLQSNCDRFSQSHTSQR